MTGKIIIFLIVLVMGLSVMVEGKPSPAEREWSEAQNVR